MKVFEDINVVELASVLAGPLVGTFFAELGAKVIKVENSKTRGDITRQWKLPSEDSSKNFSAYYASANFGKSSIFLDLTSEKDYQSVSQLIQAADIVLVNFKPGDAQKLRLDYSTVSKWNPKIIYGELSGFGSSDVRSAFDVVLQAETGYMSMNGERGSRPLKMPIAFMDIMAAHQLKEGILCGLLMRMQTNRGYKVSVSLYDAAISSLANQATNYLMAHSIPQRIGSEHPNIAPYGDLYQTMDMDWIVLAVGTDRQFADLIEVLKLADTSNDLKYDTNAARVKNRIELNTILSAAIGQFSTETLESILASKKIPYGRVKNMAEVFAHPYAYNLILEDQIDLDNAKRVKTAIFNIDEGL